MHIERLGHHITDPQGFTIDRPHGAGNYLFLRFRSAIEIDTPDGRITAAPDCCILYSPRFPQWFASPAEELKSDWFHFDGDDIEPVLEACSLPLNRLFSPSDLHFLDALFQAMQQEMNQREAMWEAQTDALLRLFLAKLGRANHLPPNPYPTAYMKELSLSFKQLRSQLWNAPERDWRIAELADRMKLSIARFNALYRNFFGVSPKQDHILARIEKAKYLLTNQALSVGQVGAMAGYDNPFHFSRQFKKMTGMTPGAYALGR